MRELGLESKKEEGKRVENGEDDEEQGMGRARTGWAPLRLTRHYCNIWDGREIGPLDTTLLRPPPITPTPSPCRASTFIPVKRILLILFVAPLLSRVGLWSKSTALLTGRHERPRLRHSLTFGKYFECQAEVCFADMVSLPDIAHLSNRLQPALP